MGSHLLCRYWARRIAILAALAALWLTHARSAQGITAVGVPLPRVWSAALAAILTACGTLLVRATQPVALSPLC